MNGINNRKIALGTVAYGTKISDAVAFRQLDIFVENGGNILDTARVYAQWLINGDGSSEKCIGRWLKSRQCREKIIISDKGGHPLLSSMEKSRLSPKDIKKDLYESLHFLQTDYIDIYFLHRDDPQIPTNEIIDCLHEEVKSGTIRHIGASNWTAKRINEANIYAQNTGKTPFTASQIGWSYADINYSSVADTTMIYMDNTEHGEYIKNDLTVMAYNSQAKGFFSRYENNTLNDDVSCTYLSDTNITRYKKAKELAMLKGATVSQIALCALLNNEVKTIPIISTTNEAHLIESLSAVGVSLTKTELGYLWQ